jgi:hypothetical protein
MSTDQMPSQQSAHRAADDAPAEYAAWRTARWEEIAGPNGKAKVVANGKVIGRDTQIIDGSRRLDGDGRRRRRREGQRHDSGRNGRGAFR